MNAVLAVLFSYPTISGADPDKFLRVCVWVCGCGVCVWVCGGVGVGVWVCVGGGGMLMDNT